MVVGDWTNADTFTARSGTVTFDGTSHKITGSTTFNAFTKIDTSNDGMDMTLTFENSKTQTITGDATITGIDTNDMVILVSDSPTNVFAVYTLCQMMTIKVMDHVVSR